MDKLKRLAALLLTLCLTGVGINRLGYILRPLDTDGAYSQIETLHSLPDNSIEVMIYGSSHAFRGVDPMAMYSEYGIGAYNYAWHWQKLNTTELFIEDSLLSQSPRVALIETYYAGDVLEDTEITAEIYYTRYLDRRVNHLKYLDQCFGWGMTNQLSYYMPLCAFHENWNSLTRASFSPLTVQQSYRENMGFYPSEKVVEVTIPDCDSFVQREFSASAVRTLDDIVAMCSENDIDIVFFTVPMDEEYSYGDAMEKYAAEHGCAYLDLFELYEDVGYDSTRDFSDGGHLNKYGAGKTAEYLGAYLKDNFELTDMRETEGNIWQTAKSN